MLNSSGRHPHCICDCPLRRIAVCDDHDAAQSEQVGAAIRLGIESLAKVPRGGADEETADLSAGRAVDLVAERVEQRADRALHQLERDVAGEAVRDDDLSGALEQRAALDVALEIRLVLHEELVRLEHELASLL